MNSSYVPELDELEPELELELLELELELELELLELPSRESSIPLLFLSFGLPPPLVPPA